LERKVIRDFLTGVADKLALGDAFWPLATSDVVVFTLAGLILACVVVAHFPVISKLPMIAPYAATATVFVYVFLAAQAFLVGYRFADERAQVAKLRSDVALANRIIESKNKSLNIALDAVETMQTQRDEAAQRAKEAQDEVDDYAERLKTRPNAACLLTPDDFPRSVSNDAKRRPARESVDSPRVSSRSRRCPEVQADQARC
jgi:hypothetical protein